MPLYTDNNYSPAFKPGAYGEHLSGSKYLDVDVFGPRHPVVSEMYGGTTSLNTQYWSETVNPDLTTIKHKGGPLDALWDMKVPGPLIDYDSTANISLGAFGPAWYS